VSFNRRPKNQKEDENMMRKSLNRLAVLTSFIFMMGSMLVGQSVYAQRAPDLEVTADTASIVWEAQFEGDNPDNFYSYTLPVATGPKGSIRVVGHQLGSGLTFKAFIMVFVDDPQVGKGALFVEQTGHETDEGCCSGFGVIVWTNGVYKGKTGYVEVRYTETSFTYRFFFEQR
jgi:hypothetical protein